MSRIPEVIRNKNAESFPGKVYGAGVFSGLVSLGAFSNNTDDVGFWAAVIAVGLFWMGRIINPTTHFRIKQWNSLTMKLRALSPLLTVPLLLFTPLPSHAADPIQSWVNRYDVTSGEDRAVAVTYDKLGNTYVTGYSNNGGLYYDWVTVKYGPTGNRLWAKTYNGPGNTRDLPAAIAVDSNGRVYVTGSSSSLNGYTDFVTIKYDTNGRVLWTKTYNHVLNGVDYATALAIDSTGNVYVTGVIDNGSTSLDDYLTIKYNANGTQLWAKRFNSPVNSTDHPTAIAVDTTGNVYVTGYSWYSSSTSYDYVTIKYDTNGIQKWLKRYSGLPNTNAYDYPRGIKLDKSGNVIVTGQSGRTSSGSRTGDYATVKYNSTGKQLWVQRFDGSGHAEDDAQALAVDASGNIYVTGWSYTYQPGVQLLPAFATIKYSPAGLPLWTSRYRGPWNIDNARAIALDSTGNVYVTGESAVGPFSDYNFATVKYDTNGLQQWVKTYGQSGYDVPAAIAVDQANNVYVSGFSDGGSTYYDYATIKYSQP